MLVINEGDKADLPVASFPPFKLRSSMVDKDPVIWAHLIEVYIRYIETILQLKVSLTPKSEQQLYLFVKTYLHEISDEQGRILSLGVINVQIVENLEVLKRWALELIRELGVLNLKLAGDSLWNLARIYSQNNSLVVKEIIVGSCKPRDGKSINSSNLVHKHLISLITNSKFDKYDLEVLSILLESKLDKTGFAEKFVSIPWIESLEDLYSNGEGIFANLVKDIMILSLLPLSIEKLAFIAAELGITSKRSLRLYPLFSSILKSEKFKQFKPTLDQRLPFLKRSQSSHASEEHISTLTEMFPNLSLVRAKKLLRKYISVEDVTNFLLENPDSIEEKEEPVSSHKRHVLDAKLPEVILRKQDSRSTHVPDEHKNRTMAAVLRQMYEADEDEHDDTYDDAETASNTTAFKLDHSEKVLFNHYISDTSVFARTARKSAQRAELKVEAKMSDEQIEGWARMLERNPERIQLFMDTYVYSNLKKEQEKVELEELSSDNTKGDLTKVATTTKRTFAKNEKNKASRANHNRKRGHDKKVARAN